MPTDYEKRLRRVVDYVYDNPAGDLSLDALADVAALSRFHFHRVYTAMTGETCAQAVRRIRAHRASVWLVHTDWPVDTVAARAGYDNVQSFARLFRSQYGLTPTAFRKAGKDRPMISPKHEGALPMYPVEIRDLPARRLAALPHTGAYHEVGRTFEKVSAVFSGRNLWGGAKGMIGVYYDDPSTVAEDALRSHAGVWVGPDFDVPDDLEEATLPAGPHAVLVYKGPYNGLRDAYQDLYGRWLPESGRVPAHAAPFEVYLNSPMDTAPADLLTEICAPLAP